jgi:hypothetical protein
VTPGGAKARAGYRCARAIHSRFSSRLFSNSHRHRGDGKDTVEFDTRATTDIQAFQTFGGVTIVTFTDGQKATMLDVQELVFTDDEIHL